MQRTLIALAAVALFAVFPASASATPHRQAELPPDPSSSLLRAQAFVEQSQAVAGYVAAVDEHNAVLAVVANNEAFLESLYTPPPPPAPAPVPSTGYSVPRAAGGHSDAWWHGVAICEQGGRNDPYFGYFSFMDGSMGGQPWDVQVAAGNALLARVGAERESQGGPWADSCIDAGYAASPGG